MKIVKLVAMSALVVLLGAASVFAWPVTFQVDMSVQEMMGNFDPNIDDVIVRGTFNNWTGNDWMLVQGVDLVYTGTFDVADGYHEYKFIFLNPGDNWESVINRSFTVAGEALILPVVYFNNQEPPGDIFPYEIDFTVDMNVMINTGVFDPNADGMIIRGSQPEIGNWGGYTAMTANGDGTYSVTINFAGLEVGVPLEYKFVIDVGNDQQDPVIWEEPPGGNRTYVPTGDEPDDGNDGDLDVTLDPVYFSDNFGSLTSDMTITFILDGRAAIRKHNDVGIPGVAEDEIEWFIVTGPWDGWQWTPGAYGTVTLLDDGLGADAVAGDSLFSAEMTYPAGSQLNFVYKYGANGYDNEGDFGTNHFVELPDQTNYTIEDMFGSIDDWYDPWWPSPYWYTTIEEIQTGVFQEGDLVQVTGIVTQGNNTVHTTYVDVFIQDASGYGIMMYASDPNLGIGLDRGAEVHVMAEIDQYFDTTELVDFTFSVLSTGNPLPEPMTWPTGEFSGQVPFEGVWAELSGELLDDPGLPGDTYNLPIDDGSGEATIRMYGDANIDLTMYSAGDWVTFRGTVDTYYGNCQLQPSQPEDVEPYQTGPASLTITPYDTIIPEPGGMLTFDGHLVSYLPDMWPHVRFSTWVVVPNGTEWGPLYAEYFIMMPFMDVTVTGMMQTVPAEAPSGDYTLIARVGYPSIYVEDSFSFTKEGVNAGMMNLDNWHGSGWEIAADETELVNLPDKFELGQAYPNPFNPSTTVRVALPEASDLTVSVFNVMGQQVAEVANGRYVAGEHNLTFDASNLASGLYFIRATVPGQLNSTQKVMLVR